MLVAPLLGACFPQTKSDRRAAPSVFGVGVLRLWFLGSERIGPQAYFRRSVFLALVELGVVHSASALLALGALGIGVFKHSASLAFGAFRLRHFQSITMGYHDPAATGKSMKGEFSDGGGGTRGRVADQRTICSFCVFTPIAVDTTTL